MMLEQMERMNVALMVGASSARENSSQGSLLASKRSKEASRFHYSIIVYCLFHLTRTGAEG
jgi:hypothetical protein